MKQSEIIQAVLDGRGQYDYSDVIAGPVRLSVFSDALKIDGVRVHVSARTAQMIADSLDCMLTTPRMEDLIFAQLDVKIGPFPEANGPDASWEQCRRHSVNVDRALTGRAGLVGTVGKSWVLANIATETKAANYGWHSMTAPYRQAVSLRSPLWQPLSTRHSLDHFDYSQTLRLVSSTCTVYGVTRQLSEVLQDGNLSGYISHEGPLRFVRQPGVNFRDTDPAPPPWLDASLALGERCILLAESELAAGVKANPYGQPNTGPRVREYLEPCVRDIDHDGRLDNLGLTVGNWCCAFQSWLLEQCLLDGDESPHLYRAGVVEAVSDAQRLGRWHPVAQVRSGQWRPQRGDLAVWDRSKPGVAKTTWWRHVNRLVDWADPHTFVTIGGNEGRTIRLTTQAPKQLSSQRLLGFIDYRQRAQHVATDLTAEEKRRVWDLVALTISGMIAENHE